MLGFLLRPRWLLAHVAVLVIAVVFVSLGLWQLRRLDERRALNGLVEQRLAEPALPLGRLLALGAAEEMSYRRVEVRGRYTWSEEVLLTPRSDNQIAGHHVLTPLELEAGGGVLVDRGWVPFELDRPPVEQAQPPDGDVTVEGIVVPAEAAARFGSAGGGTDITFLSSVDVARIQPQTESTLYPFGILLQRQEPGGGPLPRPSALPELSEGSHLSYALQWFAFTLIGLIGYPLLLRRSVASRRQVTPQREPVATG